VFLRDPLPFEPDPTLVGAKDGVRVLRAYLTVSCFPGPSPVTDVLLTVYVTTQTGRFASQPFLIRFDRTRNSL
jgi:hypothetical protein